MGGVYHSFSFGAGEERERGEGGGRGGERQHTKTNGLMGKKLENEVTNRTHQLGPIKPTVPVVRRWKVGEIKSVKPPTSMGAIRINSVPTAQQLKKQAQGQTDRRIFSIHNVFCIK